ADTAILAVDSSKFDKVSFVKSMRLKQGDILVTDRLPSEDWQNYLQERGVQLVTPEAQEQDQKERQETKSGQWERFPFARPGLGDRKGKDYGRDCIQSGI